MDHGTKISTFVNESNPYHDHVFCMLQIYASNRQSARSWKLTCFDENKFRGICDYRSCSRVGSPLWYLATSPSSQSLLYSSSLVIHETIAKIDLGFLEDHLTYATICLLCVFATARAGIVLIRLLSFCSHRVSWMRLIATPAKK